MYIFFAEHGRVITIFKLRLRNVSINKIVNAFVLPPCAMYIFRQTNFYYYDYNKFKRTKFAKRGNSDGTGLHKTEG